MPKYLLLLNELESPYVDSDDAMFNEIMAMHDDFTKRVVEAGATVLGGEALRPLATSTFLRATRSPEVAVVDNPAPDVKEVLGGYYLIEAVDEAHAVELAKQCPSPHGFVEVRPVWEFDA